VLADGGGLAEVNPDDPKQGKAVYFVLLADMLLLAYRKKKNFSSASISNNNSGSNQHTAVAPAIKQKFAVEKCLTLLELAVIDMKDSPPGTFLWHLFIKQFDCSCRNLEFIPRNSSV
jgi:hypothetical protein